jgi:hypothetical protein
MLGMHRVNGRLSVRQAAAPAALVLALFAAVAGCSYPQSAAEDVSTRFTDAVAESGCSTACGLLAPQTRSELEQSSGRPCSAALEAEELSDAVHPYDCQLQG